MNSWEITWSRTSLFQGYLYVSVLRSPSYMACPVLRHGLSAPSSAKMNPELIWMQSGNNHYLSPRLEKQLSFSFCSPTPGHFLGGIICSSWWNLGLWPARAHSWAPMWLRCDWKSNLEADPKGFADGVKRQPPSREAGWGRQIQLPRSLQNVWWPQKAVTNSKEPTVHPFTGQLAQNTAKWKGSQHCWRSRTPRWGLSSQ